MTTAALTSVFYISVGLCYLFALASVLCRRMDRRGQANPCLHRNSVDVLLLTGERCASWCPDCERRFYWLPYVFGRSGT